MLDARVAVQSSYDRPSCTPLQSSLGPRPVLELVLPTNEVSHIEAYVYMNKSNRGSTAHTLEIRGVLLLPPAWPLTVADVHFSTREVRQKGIAWQQSVSGALSAESLLVRTDSLTPPFDTSHSARHHPRPTCCGARVPHTAKPLDESMDDGISVHGRDRRSRRGCSNY